MVITAEAKRILFRVAKDRSHFLLEVRSIDDRQIEISFPAPFAETLLAQAQKLAARFTESPEQIQEEELSLFPANEDNPDRSDDPDSHDTRVAKE